MSGPQFFQTNMGRRFYDAQLPQLIKALERIADALEYKEPPDEQLMPPLDAETVLMFQNGFDNEAYFVKAIRMQRDKSVLANRDCIDDCLLNLDADHNVNGIRQLLPQLYGK